MSYLGKQPLPVPLNALDITSALGFTPYNATNPSGYISGNQNITFSGDASGSGATSVSLTLANSGVVAGTYTKLTVDAKGRVTTGASLDSADLPTYTGTLTSSQVTTGLGYTPLNPTTSQTANFVYAAPSGSAGAPTFRALVAADIPILNQNTTGTASNVTGTVAIANGGTGATSASVARTNLGVTATGADTTYAFRSNNLSDLSNAATARTNLGATTIGSNLFTLTNPGAIAFPRFNADNTVSALDASSFRTAIGAGDVTTSGTQTLTNKTISGGIHSGVIDDQGSVRSSINTVAALDIDCSVGNFFTKTINGNSTFTFSNAPASRAFAFTLELVHTSGTVTWPGSVVWPNNTAPTLTTGRTHLFTFVTDNNGSTWRGVSNVNYTS